MIRIMTNGIYHKEEQNISPLFDENISGCIIFIKLITYQQKLIDFTDQLFFNSVFIPMHLQPKFRSCRATIHYHSCCTQPRLVQCIQGSSNKKYTNREQRQEESHQSVEERKREKEGNKEKKGKGRTLEINEITLVQTDRQLKRW